MFRLGRILAFVGAAVLLFVGFYFLPWATYNNLRDPGWYEITDATLQKLRQAKVVPFEVIESLKPLRTQVFYSEAEFVSKLPEIPERVPHDKTILNAARFEGVAGFASPTTAGPVCQVNGSEATGQLHLLGVHLSETRRRRHQNGGGP
jgi:hypothetical protein